MAIIKCKWCSENHETNTCEKFKRALESPGNLYALKFKAKMENGGHRICRHCASNKHWGPSCPVKFNTLKSQLVQQKVIADKAFEWLHEIGFGPGCMITGMARERTYRAKEKGDKAILIEEFTGYSTQNVFFQKLLYGKVRNWYNVTASDTAMEKVKQVYLPYHPVYAPTPTSKRVEVIVRASFDDIENLKRYIPCYTDNMMKFDTAEEFFKAGLKLSRKQWSQLN